MPSFDEDMGEDWGEQSAGAEPTRKRPFGAPRNATEYNNKEQLKTDLVLAIAAVESLKRIRMHDAMLCDYIKSHKSRKAIAMIAAVTKWLEAVGEHPQNHGQGPLFPYPYKKMITGATKELEGAEEWAAKYNTKNPGALQALKDHLAKLTDTEATHDWCTHCTAKISYSEEHAVLEVCFAMFPEAQVIRKAIMEIFVASGAERCVGPPPPSEAERNAKKLVAELKDKLGYKQKVKGKGKGRGKTEED
jgi:hypothetical protein